jgi:PAS domain S-box-containing protein
MDKPTYEELEKTIDELKEALYGTKSRCRILEEEIEGQRQVQNIILDSIPAAVFFKDKDNKIIRVNKAFADNAGCRKEEIEGRSIFDFFPEKDCHSLEEHMEILNSGIPKRNILEYIETQYGPRWFEVDKIPYIDKEGKIAGVVCFAIDVTEKKKSLEALHQSECRYRRIFDTTGAYIWEIDYSELKKFLDQLKSEGVTDISKYIDETPDFMKKAAGMITIKDVNEATVKMHGLNSKKDLIEKLGFLMLEQGMDTFRQTMIAYAEGKTIYESEKEVMTMKGETVNLLTRISIPEENEEFKNLLITSLDVSRIKKVEKALENERNLIRTVIDNIPDRIYVTDRDGKFILVNKSVMADFNTQNEKDVLGKSFYHILPKDCAKIFYDEAAEIFRTGVPVSSKEWPFIFLTGKMTWQSTSVPLRDSEGNIFGIVGIYRDITDLKKTEEALSKSLREQKSYIDAIQECFYVFDQNLRLIKWNKTLRDRFSHYTDEELLGKTPDVFFDEEATPRIRGLFEEFLKEGVEHIEFEEYFIKKDDKPTPFQCIQTKLYDENGKYQGFVGVARDITEHIKHEEELHSALAAAEVANKAKSEFLANMSHEIRTPMNAILGFTDLLIPIVTDPKQKNYLESIQSSGKNLLTLINDILDLSKIEAGRLDLQLESVNPHSVFNEIKQIFHLKIAEKNLEFLIDIAPDIPDALLLDEVRLRQILFNLIGNAVKFTKNGYIKLSAKKDYVEKDQSHLDLIIAVEDSGIGIPSESQEVVFDAFRQQDGQSTKKFGGTGLGLSITKRLVEMMGGSISIKSQVDKGTVFEIILQHVSVAATRTEEKIDDALISENILFEAARVLIVDDIAENRFLVKEFFENTRVQIIEADNGEEAVSASKKFIPNAIIMDIRMPVMDGYEATRRIKQNKNLQGIPVIALTASGMKADKEKIKKSGFDGFLTKPVKKSQIFNELAKFIKWSKKEKSEQPPEIADQRMMLESILSETYEKLPEIIDQLENECMKLWVSASKNNSIEDIKDFGNHIKKIGENHSLEILEVYGDKLVSLATLFDIEKMEATLRSYPKLIEQIKSR